MTHLIYSIKKLGKTFKLQKELMKTEMNHDEVFFRYVERQKTRLVR